MLMRQTSEKYSQNCLICLKIGTLYSAEYVNNLYRAVRKQSIDDFICFTDDTRGIDPGVICFHMEPRQCEGWKHLWCKIMMYGREELKKYHKKIYFDLDLVVQGDITPILEHDADWSIIECPWKGLIFRLNNPGESIFNSSVIVWKDNTWIFDMWESDWKNIVRKFRGNDYWYHVMDLRPSRLPKVFYSYREGSKPSHYWANNMKPYLQYQSEYSVCLFHQKPDIHELDKENPLYKIWNGNPTQ